MRIPALRPHSQRVSFDPQDFQIREGTGADGLTDAQRLNLTPAGHAGIRFVGRFTPDSDLDEMLTFLGFKLLSWSQRIHFVRLIGARPSDQHRYE